MSLPGTWNWKHMFTRLKENNWYDKTRNHSSVDSDRKDKQDKQESDHEL